MRACAWATGSTSNSRRTSRRWPRSRSWSCESPPTVRIPDVVVTRSVAIDSNPPRVPAADVLLAVEILSDGTRRVDRVMKFSEYADAGIPQYWIVDLGAPTTLLAYQLVDGDYELSGEHTGQVELSVAGHPVTRRPRRADPEVMPATIGARAAT